MAKKQVASLAELEAQIASLQAQADEARAREIEECVANIKNAIAHYGLTASDLGLVSPAAKRRGRKPGKAAAAVKPAGVIRFRDGKGNSWTGRGKRPQWFKDALESGKSADELKA